MLSDLPPELLQLIFSHLDFHSLYACQLVSRHWNSNIVNGGPAIKEALWLEYDIAPQHPQCFLQNKISYYCSGSAATYQADEDAPPRRARELAIWRTELQHNYVPYPTVFHPMLKDLARYAHLAFPDFKRGDHVMVEGATKVPDVSTIAFFDVAELDGETVPRGSWADMFISMPPVTRYRMESSIMLVGMNNGEDIEVEERDGVRMKHVMHALRCSVREAAGIWADRSVEEYAYVQKLRDLQYVLGSLRFWRRAENRG